MTHGFSVDVDRLDHWANELAGIADQADLAADAADEVSGANHWWPSLDVAYGMINQVWATKMSTEWQNPTRDAVASTAAAIHALAYGLRLTIDEYRELEERNRAAYQRNEDDLANVWPGQEGNRANVWPGRGPR